MVIIIVAIVLFVGVVIGYYTVKGSGISETPYNKVYSGAAGARGKANVSGKDDREGVDHKTWTRGTR
jgi:hypothetical protein